MDFSWPVWEHKGEFRTSWCFIVQPSAFQTLWNLISYLQRSFQVCLVGSLAIYLCSHYCSCFSVTQGLSLSPAVLQAEEQGFGNMSSKGPDPLQRFYLRCPTPLLIGNSTETRGGSEGCLLIFPVCGLSLTGLVCLYLRVLFSTPSSPCEYSVRIYAKEQQVVQNLLVVVDPQFEKPLYQSRLCL